MDQLIAFCIIWVGIIVTLTEKIKVIRAQRKMESIEAGGI